MRNQKTILIVKVAIFSALVSVLYAVPGLQFSLPIFPSFLKIQFSNLPAILCGFLSGPVGGLLVILIKLIVKVIVTGSETFLVGELADVLIGVCVVLTSSLIYQKDHTKNGGKKALIFSTIAWAFMGVVANWLILAPAYIKYFMGGNVSVFVGMLSIYPWVNETNYMVTYLFVGVLPFNLLLASVSNLITYFVYKKTSVLFHKMEK